MKPLFALLAICLLAASGCTSESASVSSPESASVGPPSFSASQQPDLSNARQWVKSLDGKGPDYVKALLKDYTAVSEPWEEDGVGGILLVYELPEYGMEIFFSDGVCVLVTFFVYTD